MKFRWFEKYERRDVLGDGTFQLEVSENVRNGSCLPRIVMVAFFSMRDVNVREAICYHLRHFWTNFSRTKEQVEEEE